jgi:O-antigen/teichoic acid export membrane protein
LLPFIGALSVYVFLVHVLVASLSGLGRMDLANYVQTGGRAAGLGVSAVLLWRGRGIESLLIGSVSTYVVIHVVAIVLIHRLAPVRLLRLRHLSPARCRRLLAFGGAVFGGSIMTMLFSPFNRLMLSRYAGLAAIPVYDIAFNAAMQIRGLIEAGLRAMVPEVSRIGANLSLAAVERIRRINRRAIGVILLAGPPVYLLLLGFAPALLRLWLGKRFVDEVPVAFRIFLLGTFVSLLCVPAYHTLLGLGRATQCFIGQAILAVTGGVAVLAIVAWNGRLSPTDVALASLPGFILTSSYVVARQRRALHVAGNRMEGISPLEQMQSEAI